MGPPTPWRTLIQTLYPAAELARPASMSQLFAAESALGVRLPGDLVALLQESNGVVGEEGLGLVWDVERIVADNQWARSDPAFRAYAPLEGLLFIADAGNGTLFGHPIDAKGRVGSEVLAWNPIDDSRTTVASSVRDYLERWLDGRLTI